MTPPDKPEVGNDSPPSTQKVGNKPANSEATRKPGASECEPRNLDNPRADFMKSEQPASAEEVIDYVVTAIQLGYGKEVQREVRRFVAQALRDAEARAWSEAAELADHAMNHGLNRTWVREQCRARAKEAGRG